MNEHILKGKWKQLKGEVQNQWGKLSDDDVNQVDGQLLKLEGLIQEKYGRTKEEAQKLVKEFLDKFED